MLGGRGRMLAEFSPQILDFLYGRYEKRDLGLLDSVTGTFSFNRQQDGTRTQTLLSTNTITEDYSEVRVFGYSGQATTHWGDRQHIVFGGELYAENIDATRFLQNPVSANRNPARALEISARITQATGGRDPRQLDTLALAFAASGQPEDARQAWLRAVELARAAGDAELVAALEARLSTPRR